MTSDRTDESTQNPRGVRISWFDDDGNPDDVVGVLADGALRDLIARVGQDPSGRRRRAAFPQVCTTQGGDHCAFCPRDSLADCIGDLPEGGRA